MSECQIIKTEDEQHQFYRFITYLNWDSGTVEHGSHGVCRSLRCAVEDCVFSEISLVATWRIVFQQILNWISVRAANDPSVLTITEKAPTKAFSWLKVPTSAFTFKTLLRH